MTLTLLMLLGCPPKHTDTTDTPITTTVPDATTAPTTTPDATASSPTTPVAGPETGGVDAVFRREVEDAAALLTAPNQNNVQTAM